jgi:N-acetyl-gamma-glutamyl-phosphate reductase
VSAKVFIDGEAGTAGLQIREWLEGRRDIELVSIDPAKRKDAGERKRLLNNVDAVILCLPDEAAREAVALIESDAVKVIDASTAHRTAPDWAYGFPEMAKDQRAKIAASTLSCGCEWERTSAKPKGGSYRRTAARPAGIGLDPAPGSVRRLFH